MKAYDYDAVIFDGDVYCVGCLSDDVFSTDCNVQPVQPIFAGEEWVKCPICCECGEEHDYMTILGENK